MIGIHSLVLRLLSLESPFIHVSALTYDRFLLNGAMLSALFFSVYPGFLHWNWCLSNKVCTRIADIAWRWNCRGKGSWLVIEGCGRKGLLPYIAGFCFLSISNVCLDAELQAKDPV